MTSSGALALTPRETALIVAINAVRTVHLLPTLRIDRRLVRAARSHSRDMLRRHYFAHGDFGRRMKNFRVRGSLFAENLVWGSGVMSANSAVAQWLASPPHRVNLLDRNLRRIGVATPLGSFDGFSTATVITADFAG
ncbi:MAG TPA: CAP domain-containing protein [Gaiellaceae bacterium]|nr:CAP domain-containing protein [Gaiellaceae bacterium]